MQRQKEIFTVDKTELGNVLPFKTELKVSVIFPKDTSWFQRKHNQHSRCPSLGCNIRLWGGTLGLGTTVWRCTLCVAAWNTHSDMNQSHQASKYFAAMYTKIKLKFVDFFPPKLNLLSPHKEIEFENDDWPLWECFLASHLCERFHSCGKFYFSI